MIIQQIILGDRMQTPDLIIVCISAFATVFLLLLALQWVMNGILKLFPYKAKPEVKSGSDGDAVYAAIHSAYSQVFPQGKVTQIEELK